jgi:hydrogenase maturation protein HypF
MKLLRALLPATDTRKRVELRGAIQGVGFRPFAYSAAKRFNIRGWVLNSSDGVVIEAEGAALAVDHFLRALTIEMPPLARIDEMRITDLPLSDESDFVIRESLARAGGFALVPPDVATCADCLLEITTPSNRRYEYPFTNCTNCGPRYSIIRDVPYDRLSTTMKPFRMCIRCRSEYEDPANRRFHAEPNACPDCGPSLALASSGELAAGFFPRFESTGDNHAILARLRGLLREGEIVAIKGVGGFHLACDASNDKAVSLLRERKRRNGKAFAVMVRNIDTIAGLCEIPESSRAMLLSARCPIVLLRRQRGTHCGREISVEVAPGTAMLGVMLPYTPLHHLLFEESPGFDALVMTSGNLSEEPIVSLNEAAWPRLKNLADHFLFHNRDIRTAVDDSVVQIFETHPYPLRRSRGFAPEPIDLGISVREILACGGELKNTLCLTKDHYAILSQHIGDLENLETLDFFRETLSHLQRFFRVAPVAVAHDLHPNYMSTRFALDESGLQPIGVQHHHAHIASCMADNGLRKRVIGVALDGTGYGTDGRIWGAEFLACDFAGFERRGHLRYIPLAGGDRAVRQPWRSALSHLRAAFGSETMSLPLPLFHEIPESQIAFVEAMLLREVQVFETSSCGRLFDAVASILGLRHEITYEGQAATELEMVAADDTGSYPFMVTGLDPFQIDMRTAIQAIVKDLLARVPICTIAGRFHRTMAQVVVDACVRIRHSDGIDSVCLSGGTFQNLRLLRLSVEGLRQHAFEVFTHRRVPTNDGGLSLGQAMIANEVLQQ